MTSVFIDIQDLENTVRQLLSDLDPEGGRRSPLARPFSIELFGTPKSGKTTVKEMIKHFFKRQGWSVATPTEGAEVVEWVKRREPDYNFQTGEYALSRARELAYGPGHKSFHLVIFDRGIYDVIARMEYYAAKGIVTAEERDAVEKYFLLPFNRGLFDLHVCLVAEPQVAIQRELARALTRKHGETMNPQTLADLLAAHDAMWERLRCADDPRMAWHDSSKETPGETAKAVLVRAIDLFRARLERRIADLPRC